MNYARGIATTIAAGRVALGLGLAVAPGRIGRAWIGPDSGLPGGGVAVRATGVRDVVVGLGLLMALRRGAPIRGWVEAGMAADAGDAVFTLLSFPRLPKVGRIVTLASAVGAAGTAALIAREVDGEAER